LNESGDVGFGFVKELARYLEVQNDSGRIRPPLPKIAAVEELAKVVL